MMHAKIIEEPGPSRTEPTQRLIGRINGLSRADRDYYRLRATQEADAAHRASCIEARLAHQEMAEAYRLLCGSGKCQDDPHLAEELSVFLFDGKRAD